MKGKVHLLIFSDKSKGVRSIYLSKGFIFSISIILAFLALALFHILKEYRDLKLNSASIPYLRTELAFKTFQIQLLSERLSTIRRELSELKKLDKKLRVMMNLETKEDGKGFYAVGGEDLKGDNILRLYRLENEVISGIQEKTDLLAYLQDKKRRFEHTPSIRPTKGWISSPFGYRISPFTGKREFHSGIDICTRTGSPVVAPASGKVTNIRRDYINGLILTIRHGYGFTTKYAHLSKVLVKKGERVKRGQKIALVGATGKTTGPHLHYEVHINGRPVNPMRYILD